jgi:hypothetical protein
MIITLPDAGIVLGTDRAGNPVLLPAMGVHIGVLAFPPLVLAFRFLGAGCAVTVFTQNLQRWAPLKVPVSPGGPWPTTRPAPPGQVLITDLPVSPRRPDHPWCTVVHVAARASDVKATADAILTRAGEELTLVTARRTVPFRPVFTQAEGRLLPPAAVGVQAHANPGPVPGR